MCVFYCSQILQGLALNNYQITKYQRLPNTLLWKNIKLKITGKIINNTNSSYLYYVYKTSHIYSIILFLTTILAGGKVELTPSYIFPTGQVESQSLHLGVLKPSRAISYFALSDFLCLPNIHQTLSLTRNTQCLHLHCS